MADKDTELRLARIEADLDRLKALENGYTFGQVVAELYSVKFLHGLYTFNSVGISPFPVFDISGQGRTFSATGGWASFLYGPNVPYAAFNGSSNYLSRADDAHFMPSPQLAFCFWYFPTSFAGTQTIWSKDTAVNPNRSWAICTTVSGNGQPNFFTFPAAGANGNVQASNQAVLNNWNFFYCDYTPSTSMKIMLNGVWTTQLSNIPAVVQTSVTQIDIGRDEVATPRYYSGSISLAWVAGSVQNQSFIDRFYHMTRVFYRV